MFLDTLLAITGALAATAATVTVAAEPAVGQSRQYVVTAPRDDALPTRRVSFADLDLAVVAGEATLRRRVGAAVRDVCRESVGLMPQQFLDQKCRSSAWSGARPQIDRAVQRARDIAQTGGSSIAAAAITISAES